MLDQWIFGAAGAPVPDRDSLERWQLNKLNETLRWASENSSFYAERLKGIQIRSFEEYAQLSFTTPEDLRSFGSRMLCVPAGRVQRIVTQTTSGSSGEPKRVCFSTEDLDSTVEYFQNGLNEFVVPKDRVLLLFPGVSAFGLNDLIQKALQRLKCTGLVFGYPDEGRHEELLSVIKKEEITFLIGTAASMAGAARFSVKSGKAQEIAERIHGVLAAAAYVDEKDRQDLISIWNCDVNEHYSMTETGYAGATGCCEPGGYHIWESGVYYEIIDPVTGHLLPDGETGEIVVTTLGRRAQPFIRYRTGDKACILPGKCRCGSCLKRLGRVQNRPVIKKWDRGTCPMSQMGQGDVSNVPNGTQGHVKCPQNVPKQNAEKEPVPQEKHRDVPDLPSKTQNDCQYPSERYRQ